MQLVLLLLIAGVGGYFLARSRFSEPIDDTAEKVAQTSRGWVDRAGDWWRQRFGKRPEVVDVESREPDEGEEEVQAAAKRPSRRKSEDESEEKTS
jgi:hypothetical protein